MPSFRKRWRWRFADAASGAVLVVFGLFNAGYWYRLDSEKKSNRRQKCGVAEQKTANSPTSRHAISSAKDRPIAYKRRVDVIDNLRNNRDWTSQPAGHDWRNRERHRSCVAETACRTKAPMLRLTAWP